MPDLSDRSVVITGASSGIGRATALAFARRGARLTLIARRENELARLAKECLRLGAGGALVESADVTDAAALRKAANSTIRRFGKIDLWVNNAGVGAVGRFTDTPLPAHAQVVQTNLMGYMNGAYAVLPHFQQRHRGTLVNVVSFGAYVAIPYAASYAASKYGLRGFSESLRAELHNEPNIQVCDVFPGFVDTPGIAHGANYTGHRLHVVAPDNPEAVADAIVRLAKKPRDATNVGAIAKFAPLGYAVAPGLARWIMGKTMGAMIERGPKSPPAPGALFKPMKLGTTTRSTGQGTPQNLRMNPPPAARPLLPKPTPHAAAKAAPKASRRPAPPSRLTDAARTVGFGLVLSALLAAVAPKKAT